MDLDLLLGRIDLQALAEEAGACFGRNNSSVCPLHPGADNPAAFHLYRNQDGRQRWHCFTQCPEDANDGDAIDFYMRWRDVRFEDAIDDLAGRVGIEMNNLGINRRRGGSLGKSGARPIIKPPNNMWRERAVAFMGYAREQLWTPTGQSVLEYLHVERGLTDETIQTWNLGYNPRDLWDDASRWGLGGGKRVWLPRGVVVPGIRDEDIWYLKVRRPLPDNVLAQAIGSVDRLPAVKYVSVRGGKAILFGTDQLSGLPIILLVEGEFDALLAWQTAVGLCDVASLGGATHRVDVLDAVELVRAWLILVTYDDDAAGQSGGTRLRSISQRFKPVLPPAHDLTDYWRQGGDLGAWIAELVAEYMEELLNGLDDRRHTQLFVSWLEIYERALMAREASSSA